MSLKNLAYITKAMNKQLHNIYITRTKIEKNGTLISLDNTKDVTKHLHNTLKRRQPHQKKKKNNTEVLLTRRFPTRGIDRDFTRELNVFLHHVQRDDDALASPVFLEVRRPVVALAVGRNDDTVERKVFSFGNYKYKWPQFCGSYCYKCLQFLWYALL